MMCFRDMTFCSAKCANYDCQRKFTDKDRVDSVKWWGSEDAPIAFSDFTDGCDGYVATQSQDNQHDEQGKS